MGPVNIDSIVTLIVKRLMKIQKFENNEILSFGNLLNKTFKIKFPSRNEAEG